MISTDTKTVAEKIKLGGIGIIPTDTIYGIVASAFNKNSVEKIYKIRSRRLKKPMIILISSIENLKLFNISPDIETIKILKDLWPNPISIILKAEDKNFEYLHRGTNTLAFRFPKNPLLIKMIKITGPLVAPSANPEGKPPAQDINQALNYFNNNVDFYLDGGKLVNKPSTVVKIENGKPVVLREGIIKVK